MKVFFSNLPSFILTQELQKNSYKTWVYFGIDSSVLKKLERVCEGRLLQIDYGEKLHRITSVQRRPFILWIDQVAESFLNRKEWLFSVSAVKNTYTSNLFLYICYLLLLEDFIKEKKQIDLIFVDSPALAAVFNAHFPGSIAIPPINKWLNLGFHFKVFTKSILRFGKYLLDFIRRYISAKFILKSRSSKLLKNKNNLVFIRNFITGQFSATHEEILESHYFPGLYDYLEKKNYTPVFLPIATQTLSYRRLYKQVLKSKKAIIFAEEFLKVQDYLYTFLTPLRAFGLKLSPPSYGRFQLDCLLKEEFSANLTEFGFLYATLLSCLGKRFKELHVTPRGIINWMENQALEKGLIKGFKENYPDIHVIGSQPFFTPENYFSTVSSNQEKQSGLMPEKILVLGPAGKEGATEFIQDVPVAYSPAFRYSSAIFEFSSANNLGNNFLVLLPIRLENAVCMIRTLLKIEAQLQSFDRIMIKMHPIGNFDKEKLAKAVGENFPKRFEFVNGKLEHYMKETAIGFCGASSTAAELVMKGIPVIAIGDSYALTMDFLAYREDQDMWQLCFSSDQVVSALNHFKALKKEKSQDFIQKAREFCNDFIAEPSEKYWENYLVKI